ncbi:MAG: HAMP domain-containing histidine kinase [Bacteroidales bacterium]|nr:HAMP domain-containing histidine kinase [Bacteroidales bacterium]
MFDLFGHMKGDSGDPVPVQRDQARNCDQMIEPVSGCSTVLTELSREMRTQMNAIVAFSFMMNKKEYCEPEKEEFSNHIYNSCEQIISLFDNFLDSAIIDAGNSISEPGVVHTGEMFSDLFSEFREILKHERYKDLLLVTDNMACQSTDCLFDANRVTRVIRNLFQIALNHTKSGYIKVGYKIAEGHLKFCITDSGQGFLKCREFLQSRDLSESLAKFDDIHMAVSMDLVRKLIRMMDGSIRIENNGKTGSSISFSISVMPGANSDNSINKFSSTMSPT